MVEKINVFEIPELVNLLDNEENESNGIDAMNLFVNSGKIVNWKCPNGHTFKEKVGVIYKRKHKCFYCTGRLIWSGENDLQKLHPDLAKEFDVEKNGITPDKVSPRDTKPYWWTCEKKHPSFQRSITHRVNRESECPYCAGRLPIPNENDLATLFPDIAKEFDKEKNGISPSEVLAFTYRPYWWTCPKGHSYRRKVALRTKFHKPNDCPKCAKASCTSFPEQAIFYYAKKCFPDAINRYKDPFENGMELDIYIPSYRMGIEYDGIAYHNDEEQHDRERRKYAACRELGIRLVRIKESEDSWIDTADELFYTKKRMKDEEITAFLSFMFSKLFALSMHTFDCKDKRESYLNHFLGFPTDFNIKRDRPEILEYLVDVDNSFGALYPELASMWDEDENKDVTPFMFTPGSNYPAIWKCPKCGDTWNAPIAGIVSRKPNCCRTCSMKNNGVTLRKRNIAKYGSLAERSELLLKQWDNEENGDLSPYKIPLNYKYKVAWKCDVCGYKWSSSPNSRVRTKEEGISGCPHCAGRVAMPGVDDFETLHKDLAKEWDKERNKGVLPSQIKPYSNKKYYWICPKCKKSYPAFPGNRIGGSGCPDCARIKVGIANSKLVGQFDEAGTLINTYQGLHEAARAMQCVPNSIFQAVKYNRKSKGYYWRYI
ncbi:Probable Zinc-ribbon domain-containing protein [Pseudobutyrivibrio sp. YE44]|uniref:zinc-ribbon domain-containing protein n=1 Tax=Pseudobutyrivibrio sp. YE44 TaxID=1520802 RepID=UPI000883A1D5|nr:zinc-ribbon domain-containing protein [Pseudobutyrivibrio sp. YE44]SDB07616.1 Probable Zinc-ribbon domain-containing protein [Pseudobutyrivibrio sp. YE44]